MAERWADVVFLVLQQEGTARCWEAGLEFRASPGEIVLVDPCLDSSIGSEGSCRFLSYTIPRSIITSLEERGLAPLHRVIGHTSGITPLLAGTLGSMLDPAFVDDRARRSACKVVSDLLAEALQAQEGRIDPETALVESMRDWVVQHLGSNRIGAAELAREFGLSERGLYRLFARRGTTPDRWLWHCRIEAATERLQSRNASIKTIALDAGFKSVPHFTRMFRAMHGISPTAFRERVSGGAIMSDRPAP